MLSWLFVPTQWSFDVASLMVLVGEAEEMRYRLSQRSLLEVLVAAPVIGLQNYIRSYDFLLDVPSRTYFSPYGCKQAPLRNARLDNAITMGGLLEDGRYGVYHVRKTPHKRDKRRVMLCKAIWAGVTWLCFASLLALLLFSSNTTWIGFANCVAHTTWSICLRVVEYLFIQPAGIVQGAVMRVESPDAVYILGRDNSAFVLEGTCLDLKAWVSRGLRYGPKPRYFPRCPIPARVWQTVTRLVTFFLLVLVFVTSPNSTTIDQTAFVLLNVLGQVNVHVGRQLNTWDCLTHLERQKESKESVPCRTHINALLIRKFNRIENGGNDWVNAVGLLPSTHIWDEWRRRVAKDEYSDAKRIYKEVFEEKERCSAIQRGMIGSRSVADSDNSEKG